MPQRRKRSTTLPDKTWFQVFGDDVLASAILDRLLHHCDAISINRPSYRLKDHVKPKGGAKD